MRRILAMMIAVLVISMTMRGVALAQLPDSSGIPTPIVIADIQKQDAVASDYVASEHVTDAADPVDENPVTDELDELDSLLDLADRDVGALSSVNVSRNTMAPALNTEVTTVNRQKSTIGRSPAAVFVVSNEMIRRSGARSIPDVLRMVPGVQVARIDSSKWAVSIRGSNGRFANKLLVQIDGRTVYTPLFGGTFWDVQDVLLEDVERIEVSRGPGAAVWGANAVNGVINIISKDAKDTRGGFVEAGAGSEERGFASGRLGWQTENGVDMRVYGKWFDRDEGELPTRDTHDDWRLSHGGFRADYAPDQTSHLTVQGDVYGGSSGSENILPTTAAPLSKEVVEDSDMSGWNGLLRYSQTLSEDNQWSVQAYFDHTDRQFNSLGFREQRDTFDLDFQHQFRAGGIHSVVWGAGYRNSSDEIDDAPFFLAFDTPSRAIDQFSYFVQDEMELVSDSIYFTVGSKFTHTDYVPFEWQPTTRLLWTPNERQSIWASYSRAVRSPTRVGDDVRLTLLQSPSAPGAFPVFTGDRSFASENLDAWEIGMRAQPTQRFSWDAAAFYFDYDDVQSTTTGTPFFDATAGAVLVPLTIGNNGEGYSYGFELATNFEVHESWRLYGAYTYLREKLTAGGTNVDASPRNQLYLQSSCDLTRHTSLDTIWRYVDSLPAQATDHYNTMDLRIAWRPSRQIEVAVVGRNLFAPDHREHGNDGFTGNLATNVQREAYGVISLRY